MIKIIIFDFDGVLITGSNTGYFNCYHNALEAVGVQLVAKEERQRILDYWGKGHKEQLSYLLKEHPERLSQAVDVYEHCYNSSLFTAKIRLVEGAVTTLRDLAETYKLGIATGMTRVRLNEYLKAYNLTYISETMTYDDAEKFDQRKPSPYMLNVIMNRLHVKPEETMYVGDAETDMYMAKSAGVIPVAVLTGHLRETEAKKLGVKYILPDITYLPNILR